jgi:hypothetical protein
MHLKYKMMFHDQNGQHSYVDLVMYLMVSRSAYFILVLNFNFLYFYI